MLTALYKYLACIDGASVSLNRLPQTASTLNVETLHSQISQLRLEPSWSLERIWKWKEMMNTVQAAT